MYEGQWYLGKKHGKGEITESNGNKYVGKWVEGKYQVPPQAESAIPPPKDIVNVLKEMP